LFIFAANTEYMNPQECILIELQFLPPIQYLSKLIQYDTVIIEQHENYTKGSYRNRTHIAGVNGVQRLSIPLQGGKNSKQNIRDVRIAYDMPWQSNHWTSIKSAYGNSPYFEFYADELQFFFKHKYEFLFDLNWMLLKKILELINLEAKIEFTTNYQKEPALNTTDFRNAISPKPNKRVLDKAFNQARYPQVFEEKTGFLPNLGILDLLFCIGPMASSVIEESVIKNTF